MPEPLRIGNAQGFWGDAQGAAARLLSQQPNLDYLTLDYLAEVSLSIMAQQRKRNPEAGFAADFVDVVRSLSPFWRDGAKVRVVTNAGGLNPHGCARACIEALREAGCKGMRVARVSGDDVLDVVRKHCAQEKDVGCFASLDTGKPISTVLDMLETANAYLGAAPIVDALGQDADIIVTGRVADPSLVVAPCMHAFGWKASDHDRLAGATIAGHLIECGTQVTGGIATNWLKLPDMANAGFPVVEVHADGACIVTKPAGTGGCVSEETVKEQLLYEI
ncbi:MAG: acyclic terpene utilization AtuA family protein, partial [Candidatus Hydrogenedentes bacterium]|nr:acyclic terpene utilization AtuA family protein [Candidatus Hydrogenedentota bacterium]